MFVSFNRPFKANARLEIVVNSNYQLRIERDGEFKVVHGSNSAVLFYESVLRDRISPIHCCSLGIGF